MTMKTTRVQLLIPQDLREAIDAKRGDKPLNQVAKELFARWVGKPALGKTRGPGRPPNPAE